MPKENKTTSRRSRRQCPEVDTETAAVSGTRELVKSIVGSNRYSPFPREALRRDTKTEKENMAVSSTEVLQTITDGIIESGIKYIMFPLHLLRFCIFGTSSGTVASENKKKETQQEKSTNKENAEDKDKKTKERDGKGATDSETSTRRKEDRPNEDCLEEERTSSKSSSSSAIPRKEDRKEVGKTDAEESTDEMVTAAEDSDSSVDYWSSASSMMDYDNIDKSMSHAVLEEPMDISMEEQTYEKSHSAIKSAEGNRVASCFRVNATKSLSSRLYIDEQDSNSSVDEEIARIFQKQCTSSEDECTPSYSNTLSSSKREQPKQKNFLCSGSISSFSTSVSRSKKEPRDDERERKKKTSSDVVVNHKRRKVAHDEDKDERRNDRRDETKMRDEKRSSRQDTPSKSKTRSSKTPVKNKESKRKDVKYKETATQTDSAFSDEDVEMLPVETKLPERQFCCKYAAQRLQINLFQGKEMERELNYIPDNEDSNDGFIDIARKRISSCSTSSSSTDLGFDERVSATPEADLTKGRRHSNSPDTINTHRMSTRAPPGFPQLPQNPPLITCTYNDSKHFVMTSSRNSRFNPSIVQSTAIVPPAPSPLRHLYYDYPEFMDLPAKVNSSKILTNILQNNYYR